ncbi:MAG: 50S ribosomal protein L18 [Patescibacteria group bacterium]|nr:50S ribosomal protein L18 [Patescibacteria group bacterium]
MMKDRARKNRAKLNKNLPKLSVFRSNKYIYAQVIESNAGKVLCVANDTKLTKQTKTKKAFSVGEEIGKLAVQKGIKKIVFDRGAYKYHGRVKGLAEGARKGGLQF